MSKLFKIFLIAVTVSALYAETEYHYRNEDISIDGKNAPVDCWLNENKTAGVVAFEYNNIEYRLFFSVDAEGIIDCQADPHTDTIAAMHRGESDFEFTLIPALSNMLADNTRLFGMVTDKIVILTYEDWNDSENMFIFNFKIPYLKTDTYILTIKGGTTRQKPCEYRFFMPAIPV